jgi:hypothetical protein
MSRTVINGEGSRKNMGVMYPNLSPCTFHIRSRTSACLNIPPVHIMVAEHGLINKR